MIDILPIDNSGRPEGWGGLRGQEWVFWITSRGDSEKSLSFFPMFVRTLIYFRGATDCGWELETHRPFYQRNYTFKLWFQSPAAFEETGRSHKTSLDTSPSARSLPLFLFQNHPPSWGFLSQEKHLSTGVLTHQRVGKKRTGGSGSCKARGIFFLWWLIPHHHHYFFVTEKID